MQVQAHVKNKIYNNITVSVPLYPYDKVRLMDAVDNSLTYYKGDNLVFDVTVNDIYGNKINVPEASLTFSASLLWLKTSVEDKEEEWAKIEENILSKTPKEDVAGTAKFHNLTFNQIYHEGIMSF